MTANHYDTLKVAQDAPDYVIKAAYRALSQKYHPDKNPSQEAAAQMRDINAAYDVLSDASKRADYDRSLFEAERSRAGWTETQANTEHTASSAPEQEPPPEPTPQPTQTQSAWETTSNQPRGYGVWVKRLVVLAALALLAWWGYTYFSGRDSKQRFFTIAPTERASNESSSASTSPPPSLGSEQTDEVVDESFADMDATDAAEPTAHLNTGEVFDAEDTSNQTSAPNTSSDDGWMPVDSVRSVPPSERTQQPPSALPQPSNHQTSERPTTGLRVLHRVKPTYPRRALQRRTEGYVTLQANVLPDGRVVDVRVAHSRPKRVFDRAAISAMQQWRFDNPTGRTQSTTQTIRFSLSQ